MTLCLWCSKLNSLSISRNHDQVTQDNQQTCEQFHVGTILRFIKLHLSAVSQHRGRHASTHGEEAGARDGAGCKR